MHGAVTFVAASIVQTLLSPAIKCPACTLDAHASVQLLHCIASQNCSSHVNCLLSAWRQAGRLVQMFCRERANLSVQLKDTKTVVGRLESVVGLILHIVAIFLYLIIFDVSFLPSYDVVSKRRAWCTFELNCLLLYAQCISDEQQGITQS